MSSKILSGQDARGVVPITWPTPGQAAVSGFDANLDPQSRSDQAAERRVAEARAAGFREGEATGHHKAAASLEPVLARLGRMAEELAGLRSRVRREAEEDVVKLAVAIARRVLHRELAIDPEALLGLVNAALKKLEAREIHRVRVHPDDAERVRNSFLKLALPRQIEVAADAALEHGAILFETARGVLDASVETQLAEIERGFADLVRRT